MSSFSGLRLLGLVSAALVAFSAAPAAAQDDPSGERLAAHCVEQMALAAANHRDRAQAIRGQAVEAIAGLARDGAPDRVIVAAGQRGVDAIQSSGEASAKRVRSLSGRCVAALEAIEADRALIARVRLASAKSVEAIRGATKRNAAVVREAVRRAIG